jgi:quercetin dioxygenase-like cupin family protein
MRFALTNTTDKPLEVFVEMECTSVTLAPKETVVVTTDDADESYIEVNEGLIVIYNMGKDWAEVRVGSLLVKPFGVRELPA